jgi:hypothetical protein
MQAYKGPEDWMAWARGGPGGANSSWTGDVVDFYR